MASASAEPGSVLIVGATGKQGGAVVKALLAEGDSSLKILALTRDTTSARAQALVASETPPGRIQLVQGDAFKPKAIFAGLPQGSVGAVFLVTNPPKEELHAIPFIDAAVEHGVRHIVFSSVDRGGDVRSWDNPTGIVHFREKHNIEIYLRDKAQEAASTPSAFTWTILRPVAFMDNLNPGGMFCSLFISMWSIALRPERKLQLVATSDIGQWAARAITSAAKLGAKSPYSNRAVSLAGDELTLTETRATFRRVTGRETPWAWWIFGRLVLWLAGDAGKMFQFFDTEGYGADIAALRSEELQPKTLETWLRTESGWKKKE